MTLIEYLIFQMSFHHVTGIGNEKKVTLQSPKTKFGYSSVASNLNEFHE